MQNIIFLMKHFRISYRVIDERSVMRMGIESLRSDDTISELVQKYSDMVLRLALTYLKDLSDAQDVCQIVFVKIFEQNKTFVDSEYKGLDHQSYH